MKKSFSTLLFTIVAIVCFCAMNIGCQNQSANVSANKEHAESWVANSLPGYRLVGFNSATLDTDGDGYVTCDITVTRSVGSTIKLIQLSCPTTGNITLQKGEGCKFVQMPFNPDF